MASNYTRTTWAIDFLGALGNTSPDPDVVQWVVAWTKYESAPPGCAYNLLNTTQTTTGSTLCGNSPAGVQNFPDYKTGITTNVAVLNNGRYGALLHALQTNDKGNLGIGSGTVAPNINADLNTWCGGCNYGNKIAALANSGNTGGGDVFPGDSSSYSSPGSLGSLGPTGVLSGLETTSVVRIGKGVLGGLLVLAGVIGGIMVLLHPEVATPMGAIRAVREAI